MLTVKPLPTEADKPPAARPTMTEVIERLDLLGSSMAIAEFFATQGITGYRMCANDCPIAHYVERETGQHRKVFGLGMPNNVLGFISDFDRKHYPNLIAKDGRCRCEAWLPF